MKKAEMLYEKNSAYKETSFDILTSLLIAALT